MSPAQVMIAARSVILLAAACCCGCTSLKTTNTARSSTEQMLVSNAVDQALDKIDFEPFQGHAVFLDEKYVDCVDKAYLIASVRHRLLFAGSRLVDKVEDSEIVVEPRSGSVGTNNSESFLGIPEITLPGMLTLPEVRFLTKSQQIGIAKIGVAAYDTKTRVSLGAGGTTLAKSDDSNLAIMGVNWKPSGTIRNEITRSTSGPASFPHTRIPVQVVFNAPAPAPIHATPAPAQKIEYTSTEVPSAEEAPAAQAPAQEAAGTDAPDWAQ